MDQNTIPIYREGNTLDLSLQPRPAGRPASPSDIRRWLEDEEVEIIDLGEKREGIIQPTTWHSV